MKRIIIIIVCLQPSAFCLQPLFSQPLNSIYENNSLVSFDKYVYSSDSIFHTSVRPYLVTDFKKTFDYEAAAKSYQIEKFTNKKWLNLIFNRSLFIVNRKDYGFTIDPLFDFGYGYDFANDRSTWINTRGFLVEGYLGKNFAFSTRFYETQSKVPLWINNYVSDRGNMPGQGRTKTFGDGALDYANASGLIPRCLHLFLSPELALGFIPFDSEIIF